jgi:F-box/leucine-rich repeat protein 2/20
VSKCSELTDQTLIALANYNPLLSTLEVAGCHQFTDIGFQALGKVSNVNFDVISKRDFYLIYFFTQNCKYLERMDLEECSQITDLTLAHLATGCPSLEKLVNIFKIFKNLF